MTLYFPKRIKTFFKFTIFHLILFSFVRLVFFTTFKENDISLLQLETLKAFYFGLKFDLRFTLILITPIFIFSWLPFLNFIKSTKSKKIWTYLYTFLALFWGLIYAMDFPYYSYLNTHINSTLITFLYNPLISLGMVWKNYPIVWSLLGFSLFICFYYLILSKIIFPKTENDSIFAKKNTYYFSLKQKITSYALLFLLFVTGLYGKISYYPLRWSEASFSANPFISAIGVNPPLYLQKTLRFREKSYDVKLVKKYYPIVSDYLGVKNKNSETLNFSRQITPEEPNTKKPNIVLIVMESLASFKTNIGGNPINPTPYLEKISNESTYFSNYYVPSEGTARSMFGMMSAIPDVSKIKTASRNPMIVSQNVLMNAFAGYSKHYFIGGSANWGNIRGVFTNNIDNLNIMEEGSFSRSRTDVWGLSDLDLLKEANDTFDKTKEPFVAVVQCASFHRPYTIPEKKDDFKIASINKELSKENLKSAGFISIEEYNSIRFSDYSLGMFWQEAKKLPYFKNTVFIITGDHGLPNLGADHVTKQLKKLEKDQFHVPLIIYHPESYPDKHANQVTEIKTIVSEVDVMTTMASLAGVPHTNTSMGRNIFDKSFDNNRFAFTYMYHRNPIEYGLIGKDHYFKTNAEGKNSLYSLKSETFEDLQTTKPELFNEMKNLANGLYETSRYMLYHNKKLKK